MKTTYSCHRAVEP